MKIKNNHWLLALLAFVLVGSMVSCSDKLSDDEHYKTPDWLKGNALQVMQSEGNYTTFLRGIELAGYDGIVGGKSIVTVMAPDNDAFTAFLAKKNCSSIDELFAKDAKYAKNLIGMHLMYYAFDWQKMVNFRPDDGDAATDEQKQEYAGYYYKHRTHSQDPVAQERVRMSASASSDTLLSIYHYERYLPVFSNELFKTKQIDAQRNYDYFYGQGRWNASSSSADGYFNVANAKVSDTQNVITDNGYLYHVDEVIEPVVTIYDELKNNPNYSQFLSLYDAYSTYEPADDETNTTLGYIAYIHSHGELPPIAWEWPVNDWRKVSTLERAGYNVFAPTNTALQNFFQTYWTAEGGYTDIDNLDPVIKRYFIMQSFAADDFLAFPEEIEKGDVKTIYGTPINIDVDQVTDRKVCCNGLLYGMDKMSAPAIFSSVAGPAFKDKQFMDYLYCLDGSGEVLTLSSQNNSFVTLMPTNAQLENSDPAMRLYETSNGKELQQFSSETGAFEKVSSKTMSNIVNLNTATGVSELPSTGSKVVETNIPFNYWFVNEGRLTTNSLFNEQLEPGFSGDPYVAFHPILNNGKPWDNGMAYTYDAERMFSPAGNDDLAHKLAVCQDSRYEYYLFTQLLSKAGLITNGELAQELLPASAIRFFAFIPTNDAIKASLTTLPGCEKLSIAANGSISGTVSAANKPLLSNYLRSYFVVAQEFMRPDGEMEYYGFTAYPYVGSGCASASGTEYNTQGTNKLTIYETGNTLTIKSSAYEGTAKVTSKYACLPFVFSDGCMQFVDEVLK